jgi:uncharacterized protein with PhoU and TrkA domain
LQARFSVDQSFSSVTHESDDYTEERVRRVRRVQRVQRVQRVRRVPPVRFVRSSTTNLNS